MRSRQRHFTNSVETWKTLYPASSTRREAQQRIRQFLRFLHDDGYLQRLPRLSPIKVDQDRKSTRLNSSHSQISYAVFCLKKKNSVYLRLSPASRGAILHTTTLSI